MKKLFLIVAIPFFAVTLRAQITVSTDNKVGIGTPTPGEVLEINGNIRGSSTTLGALKINTASNGYLQLGPVNYGYCHVATDRPSFAFNKIVITYTGEFGTYSTSDFIVRTGVTYNYAGDVRMTIKNGTGYVGIGTTTPGYLLDVNGDINTSSCVRIAGVVKLSSDERLKNNIKNLSGSLGLLTNLRGVSFKFNAPTPPASIQPLSVSQSDSSRIKPPVQNVVDTTFYNRTHKGFLAQEVMKVFPELVYADKDGMLSVDYISLIPVLVESIKEQQVVINDLKATVEKLKKKANIN